VVIQVSTEVIPRSGIDLTALLSQQISEIATLILTAIKIMTTMIFSFAKMMTNNYTCW